MSVAGEVSAEERAQIEAAEVSFPGHGGEAIDGCLPTDDRGRRQGPEPLARGRRGAGRALRASGKEFELDIYEGAGHAFFADYRPNYVEKAAFALWDRMTGFLGRP